MKAWSLFASEIMKIEAEMERCKKRCEKFYDLKMQKVENVTEKIYDLVSRTRKTHKNIAKFPQKKIDRKK